jgi:hypothetical protein
VNKPIVPLDLKCAWCKVALATPVGEPEWSDNIGEGGDGIGRWLQVYEHKGCDSSKREGSSVPPHSKRWSYEIAREPIPTANDAGAK